MIEGTAFEYGIQGSVCHRSLCLVNVDSPYKQQATQTGPRAEIGRFLENGFDGLIKFWQFIVY
jgi:hypothetical protein